MLKPEQMSYLDIAIHKSKVSALLNEIPKYKIHISDFKESKDKKIHRIRREHQFLDDIEMTHHKINEIEESIIFIFQKLEIDPTILKKTKSYKKFNLEVDSVHNAIDRLHELTVDAARRIKGYNTTLEKYEKELSVFELYEKLYSWLESYSANKIAFEWFEQLEFRLFYDNSEDFIEIEVVLEHEEIPVVLEYFEFDQNLTGFFIINFKSNHQNLTEICHNAIEIKDHQDFFNDKGLDKDKIQENIRFIKDRILNAKGSLQKSKDNSLKYMAFKELLENIKKFEALEMKFRESFGTEIVRLDAYIPTKDEDLILNALDKKFHNDIRISTRKVTFSLFNKANKNQISKVVGSDSETYSFISERNPDNDSKTPSLVVPKKIFKPFSLLTKLYGTTNYSEIDPTPIVALTYPLLFGLMFGDIGHGLVLCIFGVLLIAKNILKRGSAYDAGFLLLWLGFAAIFGGFLYGEIFGYELIVNGNPFMLFASPMEEIELVLKTFIIIGVIHLSLGWILSMINFIQQNKKYQAFSDPFMKILILVGGSTLIFTYMFNLSEWMKPPYPILLPLIPTILLILAKPFGRVFGISYLQKESFMELFGEQTIDVAETYLGILSNVASYSRLLALAMAHMGLMLVFTTLATEIINIEMNPIAEMIIVGIILVFGNLLVIVLEALFAAIHAIRLTFYEFFGKFYVADGIPFSSTKIESIYSYLEFI